MAGRRAALVFAWDQPEDAYGEDFAALLRTIVPVLQREVPDDVKALVGDPHVVAAIGPTAAAVEAALTGAGIAPVDSSSSSGEGNDDSTGDSGTVTP